MIRRDPKVGEKFHFFESRADRGYAPATLVWSDDLGYLYQRDDGGRHWTDRSARHDIVICGAGS